jgi:EAL domain-containing protein (putative c-di-GMP-specific phosphodiesterase class I)/GGDEF domain-containing protein
MSKKKERKIKRLRKRAIWPAVVEMIITETIIFVLTSLICLLALFGIINTVVMQNMKESSTLVQTVNESWNTESPLDLQNRLSEYTSSFSDITEIILDDRSARDGNRSARDTNSAPFNGSSDTITTHFPALEPFYNEEAQLLLDETGMIHFIDPDYSKPFETLFDNIEKDYKIIRHHRAIVSETDDLADDDFDPDDVDFDFEDFDDPLDFDFDEDIKHPTHFLYSPKYFIKSIRIDKLLKNRNYINWASREVTFMHTISIYKTDIPNVNVCTRNVFSINAFQFSLVCFVLQFFLLVILLNGVYEIKKIITLVHERRRLNQLITTDIITGGNNKEYFMQKAGREIYKNRRKYAVVQLRLEKYRNFCTAYGLHQGENLLEEIYSNISHILGKKEILAHVEKSDFALLLEYHSSDELNIRIKNIMNTIRERCNGRHLTFSAGVCQVASKNDDAAQLLTFAGIAIPKTPTINDEIEWFSDSMKEDQVWERRIEDDMEEALYKHEFQVYLQPKYSTKKETLSAAEALVRWVHPVIGFISPGKFIPLFEKNGFILQLDDYMLTEVARLQANWLSQGKKLVPISVNVSRAHFAEDNLAEHITYIVDRFKVPHEYIELELTESAFFDDKATLLNTVRKLKNSGFKVSMDDFGAGYSSLNSLKELPLDIIKLDAEFFRSVDDITRSNLIVGETISLAKKLGMQIVAEGIETREQVDFLAQQDCDLIQGFYFSKPLPVTEFEERAFSAN